MQNKRRYRNKRIKGFNEKLIEHIIKNFKEYFIVTIIFIIGIIIGVLYINNIDETAKSSMDGYINSFIESLKNEQYEIDKIKLLKNSIFNNIKLAFIIWFIGSTVIAMPLIYAIVLFRGYCIGYTIAAIISVLGIGKGMVFALSSLLLQNIIIIPSILAMNVSGIRLYKAIMQDKRRENIKIEIYKHSIFSLFILIFLLLASCIETYGSATIIELIIGYM